MADAAPTLTTLDLDANITNPEIYPPEQNPGGKFVSTDAPKTYTSNGGVMVQEGGVPQIPGPPGPPGPAGPTGPQGPAGATGVTRMLDAGSGTVAAGAAVLMIGAKVTLANAAAITAAGGMFGNGVVFAGIAATGGAPGASITVIVAGPVDPNVISLGAGIPCALGLTSSGIPVRATDTTNTTGFQKFIAYCDCCCKRAGRQYSQTQSSA